MVSSSDAQGERALSMRGSLLVVVKCRLYFIIRLSFVADNALDAFVRRKGSEVQADLGCTACGVSLSVESVTAFRKRLSPGARRFESPEVTLARRSGCGRASASFASTYPTGGEAATLPEIAEGVLRQGY